MTRILSLALMALPVLVILDGLWIGLIANKFYRDQLGALYSPHVVWPAAILFYVIYLLGIAYFVLAPAVNAHSLVQAVLTGAFFALVAFGTYDLTSLAITANWPVTMTIVDMTWGVFEGGLIAACTYGVATRFFHF